MVGSSVASQKEKSNQTVVDRKVPEGKNPGYEYLTARVTGHELVISCSSHTRLR